jgi:hypothetical protein
VNGSFISVLEKCTAALYYLAPVIPESAYLTRNKVRISQTNSTAEWDGLPIIKKAFMDVPDQKSQLATTGQRTH